MGLCLSMNGSWIWRGSKDDLWKDDIGGSASAKLAMPGISLRRIERVDENIHVCYVPDDHRYTITTKPSQTQRIISHFGNL